MFLLGMRVESLRGSVNFVVIVVVYYVDGGIRCCTSTFPGIQAFLGRFFQQFLVRLSFIIFTNTILNLGGLVAEWLTCWTLDRAVCAQALTGVILLCSDYERHFTLTVHLATQVYK